MFKTKQQLDRGSIGSGLGLLVYLCCLQWNAPGLATNLVLVAGCVVALWTEVSILSYPKEQKEADINYNNLWGQGAMTLLLVGSAVGTAAQALGL